MPDNTSPITCLVTSGDLSPINFSKEFKNVSELIRSAVAANISFIQIREKSLSALNVLQLAIKAVDLAAGSSTRIVVNDRVDIALAAGAHGVHLPETGLPAAIARSMVPSDFIVSKSVHSVKAALVAEEDGANMLIFGTVFDSGTKIGVGVDALSEVCSAVAPIPVLAIGGINSTNVRLVLSAGAAGFASIRYLSESVTGRGGAAA